jgi:hypothetical protein
MKHANIGAVLNFDLQKVGQIKKNAGYITFCFRFWPPGGQAKNQIGLNLG